MELEDFFFLFLCYACNITHIVSTVNRWVLISQFLHKLFTSQFNTVLSLKFHYPFLLMHDRKNLHFFFFFIYNISEENNNWTKSRLVKAWNHEDLLVLTDFTLIFFQRHKEVLWIPETHLIPFFLCFIHFKTGYLKHQTYFSFY